MLEFDSGASLGAMWAVFRWREIKAIIIKHKFLTSTCWEALLVGGSNLPWPGSSLRRSATWRTPSPARRPALYLILSEDCLCARRTDILWKLSLSLDTWFIISVTRSTFPAKSLPYVITETCTKLCYRTLLPHMKPYDRSTPLNAN